MFRKRPLLLVLIGIMAAVAGGVALLQLRGGNPRVASDAVVVTVKPRAVLIATTETGQHVNFDFLLENRSDTPLKLTTVELSVFDRRGGLARRDFVNLFSRASVAMQGEKLIRRTNQFFCSTQCRILLRPFRFIDCYTNFHSRMKTTQVTRKRMQKSIPCHT